MTLERLMPMTDAPFLGPQLGRVLGGNTQTLPSTVKSSDTSGTNYLQSNSENMTNYNMNSYGLQNNSRQYDDD